MTLTDTQHLIKPIEPAAGAYLGGFGHPSHTRQGQETPRRRRDIASRGREWGRHDSGLPDERPIYI